MKYLNTLMSGTAPLFIIVANEKGGQGKSLVSLAVADYAHLCQMKLGIAQIDSQLRLAKAIGRKVLTIDAVEEKARRDPGAEMRMFTPFYGLLEKAAKSKANILLDIGSNQSQRFAAWSALVDLQEDLDSWNFQTLLVIPYVSEAEGIRQAGKTALLLREYLPQANLVLIENQRDGLFEKLHPTNDAAQAYRDCIEPLKSEATLLTMPEIEAGSWHQFEASNARLMAVAGMPIEKVMSLTGLPRPEAKIARGDVAGWALTFFGELDRVLAWNQAEVDHE